MLFYIFIISIFKLIGKHDNRLSAFAEHVADNNCMQEVAFLRGDDAVLFVDIIHDNADIFGVDKDDYELILPKSKFGRIKCSHSCYPKNVRRWIKGTLSRKKRCRVEFITLVACWAIGWKCRMSMEADYVECRNGILGACKNVFLAVSDVCENRENEITKLSDKVKSGLYEINTINELVEILWVASQIAYVEAYKSRAVVKDRGEGVLKEVGKDVEKDTFEAMEKRIEKDVFEASKKDVEKDIDMDLGI